MVPTLITADFAPGFYFGLSPVLKPLLIFFEFFHSFTTFKKMKTNTKTNSSTFFFKNYFIVFTITIVIIVIILTVCFGWNELRCRTAVRRAQI